LCRAEQRTPVVTSHLLVHRHSRGIALFCLCEYNIWILILMKKKFSKKK